MTQSLFLERDGARERGPELAAGLSRALDALQSLDDRLLAVDRAFARPAARVAFSSSLGIEDQVLVDAIARVGIAVDVFTLDTGRHFPETLDVLDATARRYPNVPVRVVAPDADEVEELVARDGVKGFRTNVAARTACCDVRKVRPLNRALNGATAWMTGLRRSQSTGRANVPFAAWDETLGLIKVNPIADWSLEQVEAYVRDRDVPVNALHARGYPSIGCQPCTRAVQPGEDIRAGRWWWENEDGKECGLHNRPSHLPE